MTRTRLLTAAALLTAILLATLATSAASAAPAAEPRPEMASFVPADARALVEVTDFAGFRETVLDSKLWAVLRNTEGFKAWTTGGAYATMQARADQLAARLKMTREEALRTYLGGRTAIAMLTSDVHGAMHTVVLTETSPELAQRLIEAVGATKAAGYRDPAITVYEVVTSKDHTDQMAYVGGVLIFTGAPRGVLDRVLDTATGRTPALAAQDAYKSALADLPKDWRVRAWAAEAPSTGQPGAATLTMTAGGLHVEWRSQTVGVLGAAANQPAVLTGLKVLPDHALGAIVTVYRPAELWVAAAPAKSGDNAVPMLRNEQFIRGWFPGQTMEAITAAFGPEAAAAVIPADAPGAAPGMVALLRITPAGAPVAKSLRDGLEAKAMLLASMAARSKEKSAPRISVRTETYGPAEMVIVEAPEALQKLLGNWATGSGLVVAVTDEWLIGGTSEAAVKAVVDTIAGKRPNLAAALQKAGASLPTGQVTRWGMLEPSRGANLLLDMATQFADRAQVDRLTKAANLAEIMRLVRRVTWQRIDGPTATRGSLDILAD
jgi:hypothetical protein